MTRLNITLPDEVANELKKIKNKSRFIADAVMQRFEVEKQRRLQMLLIEGYRESAAQETLLAADWNVALEDGWK